MPITYQELLTLHYNTYKAVALKSAITEPARNPEINPTLYCKYVKFQSAFKVRLQYLKEGHFVTPEKENDDKCMPPLLSHYDSKIRAEAKQPDENYKKDYSCSFDASRIQLYEMENINFSSHMKSDTAFQSLRDLILMDIAYLHARTVKWAAKEAEHLSAGAAAKSDDDDPPQYTQDPSLSQRRCGAPASDEDFDFTKWDPTDVKSVPWLELKTSIQLRFSGSDARMKDGDMPPSMLPALLFASHALAASPKTLPDGLKDYYDASGKLIEDSFGEALETFLNGSGEDPPTNTWRPSFRPRLYTDPELELIATLHEMNRSAVKVAAIQGLAGICALPTAGGSAGAEEVRTVKPRLAKDAAAAAALAAKERAEKPAGPPPSKAAPSPVKSAPPAGRGGRVKQVAKVKTSYVRTESAPALAAASPTVKPIAGAKRRGSQHSPAVVSETTGRVLLGQVSLTKQFPKSYAAREPVKDRPAEMTLSQAWHVVRRIAAQFLLDYYKLLYHCFFITPNYFIFTS